MRFAIAGNDATAFDVLRELAGSSAHSLVRCALSGQLAAAVSQASIPVFLAATVEDALLAGDVTANRPGSVTSGSACDRHSSRVVFSGLLV